MVFEVLKHISGTRVYGMKQHKARSYAAEMSRMARYRGFGIFPLGDSKVPGHTDSPLSAGRLRRWEQNVRIWSCGRSCREMSGWTNRGVEDVQ